MKILKILNIASSQHTHLNAVSFNENSENLSDLYLKIE